MADLVRYDIQDGVAVITIDNPPVNALAPEVWGQIDEAVKRGVADADAAAIVLIGAGTTFIAGADIKAFELLTTPADSMARSEGHACAAPAHRGRHQAAGRGDSRQRARRRPRGRAGVPLPRRDQGRQGRPARGHAGDHPRRRRHAAAAAPGRRQDGARDVHRRQAGAGAEGARRGHHRPHRPGARRLQPGGRSPRRRDRVCQSQGRRAARSARSARSSSIAEGVTGRPRGVRRRRARR